MGPQVFLAERITQDYGFIPVCTLPRVENPKQVAFRWSKVKRFQYKSAPRPTMVQPMIYRSLSIITAGYREPKSRLNMFRRGAFDLASGALSELLFGGGCFSSISLANCSRVLTHKS